MKTPFVMPPPISPLEEWTARRLGARRLTREAIAVWQGERLREVVAWARERSSFYRHLYRNLPASGPIGLAELESLPLLDHKVIRDRGRELVCVSLSDIARVTTLPTSGSTGTPKRFWFTEEDLQLTADHFRHGMRALIAPGGRLVVLMPGRAPGSVGALLAEGLGRDGIAVHSHGFVADCADAAECLTDFGASCLVGVPGQVVRLARSEPGRRLGRNRLRSVLLSGDHVTPTMRAAIEEAWDCEVFEHYGSTEIGLGGAVQCRAHAGLHVREADLLFEVIDPLTGRAVPDGTSGELVITTLTRRGMPLIRLRTGDLVRMNEQPCSCGSVLRSIETVIGRMGEAIRLENGAPLTIAQLDEAVYAVDEVMGFSAVMERDDTGDRLLVRLETRGDHTGEGGPAGEVDAAVLTRVAERVGALRAIRCSGLGLRVEVCGKESVQVPLSAKQGIVDRRRRGASEECRGECRRR